MSFGWAMKRNIAQSISNVPYHGSAKEKNPFLGPLGWRNHFGPKDKVSSHEKLAFRSGVWFLFVLTDAILLNLNFKKRTSFRYDFVNCVHFCLTNLKQIFKNWKGIFVFHIQFFSRSVKLESHCPMVALIYIKRITCLQFFDMLTIFYRQSTFHLEVAQNDVLFCKSSLSKMVSVKTNKNKNWTPLLKTNFSWLVKYDPKK